MGNLVFKVNLIGKIYKNKNLFSLDLQENKCFINLSEFEKGLLLE